MNLHYLFLSPNYSNKQILNVILPIFFLFSDFCHERSRSLTDTSPVLARLRSNNSYIIKRFGPSSLHKTLIDSLDFLFRV